MSARRVLLKALMVLCVVGWSLSGSASASEPANMPLIQSESPRQVSYESAVIEAQIDPVEAATTYHVEYGPDTSYGTRAPASDATVGSGSEYVTVKQPISDLQAGTTYHYRVVATNTNGTTEGPDYVLRTPALPSGAPDGCPNATVRALQQASLLPECRAYEMVSPVDKAGGDIGAVPRRTQAAVDGNSIKFFSKTAFGDAIGSENPGAEYIAKRGEDGWAIHSINPEQGSVFLGSLAPSSYEGLSPDLSKGVFYAHTPVVSGHPNVEHLENFYLRTDLQSPGAGSYELLSDAFAPLEAIKGIPLEPGAVFDWASADWSHVIFESFANLTADTAGLSPGPRLYEWHNGVVTYVGVLPDSACGSPPCLASESIGGSGAGINTPAGAPEERTFNQDWTRNAISADGSRIVFEAGPLTRSFGKLLVAANQTFGDLYMRIDKSSTVQLNASERSPSNPDPRGHQPARFVTATPDDSKIFFETEEALTNDAEASDNNLYKYEVEAPVGKRLTLITVDREPSDDGSGNPRVEHAPVPATSEDGNFMYFFGQQMLIAGQPVPTDTSVGALYVWHDGAIRLVTFHTGQNQHGEPKWGEAGVTEWGADEFRMSADGSKIAFASDEPYAAQRAGVRFSGEHPEIYVYDYDTDKMTCASCNPNGELSTSSARFEGRAGNTPARATQYLSSAMSRDGRYVFFDTGDALVAQDTNGRRDVYEYDTVTGEIHLLSDARCDCDATFVDASVDGSDAFFTTRQRLVRADVDNNADLYDVRVNGGISAQNQTSPAPCEGEECRGPAAGAPVFSVPSSASFAGAGNPAPPPTKAESKRKRPPLAQALRACTHKPKRQRARCRARIRKAYHVNRATRVQASRRAGR